MINWLTMTRARLRRWHVDILMVSFLLIALLVAGILGYFALR